MERAFATLAVGLLIVWTLAVVYTVSLVGSPLEVLQPGILLFLVLPSAFPTLCVFVWLLVDRKRTELKLAAIVGAAVGVSLLGIWMLYSASSGEGNAYAPLLIFPTALGVIIAYVSDFIGAKLPKREDSK